jgi:predicted nuclease with TOPRIM domain
MELDLLKDIIIKIFANLVFPFYLKLENNVYVFLNNTLKKINVSDYFVGQLRENKYIIKGIFKGELIDFYILHLNVSNMNIAIIIPVFYDINKILSHVLTNIFEMLQESLELKKKLENNEIELENMKNMLKEKEEENKQLHIEMETILNEKKKLENILNGQEVALFVVDEYYNIVYGNKALTKLLKHNDAKFLVNKKCYKYIFNKVDPCEWCKMKEVMTKRKQVNQRVDTDLDHKTYCFDQLMYPIVENDKVINIVETLNDITQYIALLESVEKIDMEKQEITQKNIDNIKELSTLRKAYNELYNNYLKTKDQLDKLNILTSKLVEFNNVQKSMNIMHQLKKMAQKNKLQERKLENYALKIKVYEDKIRELRQRAIYEMNRLGNIVKNRKEITNEELNNIVAFLEKQVNTYIKEDEYVD